MKTLGRTAEENPQPFASNKTYILFLKEFENNIPFSLINPTQGSYEKKADQYTGNQENKVKLEIRSLEKIKQK